MSAVLLQTSRDWFKFRKDEKLTEDWHGQTRESTLSSPITNSDT